MSILIKGMEMPQSCRDCGIEQDGFWCGVLDGYPSTRCFTYERREDCPLIEVSTPHGQLVDIESFMRGLYEEIQMGQITYTSQEVYDMLERELKDAPTIIESEPFR